MKNRKNKLINYLKLGILFFGISFTLWNCQNENIENLPDTQQTNNFEKLLNIELLSKQLNLGKDNVYVDWNAPEVLQINKKDKGGVYQYDIKLKQEILNNSNLFIEKLYYKLLVIEKEINTEFTILRFEPFKNSLNTSPSENNLKGFSGMKFIFNKEGIMQDIYTYIEGDKIASFNENQDQRNGKFTNILLPTIDGSDFDDCTDLNGNPIEGCVGSGAGGSSGSSSGGYRTETTRNYTDWYSMCNSCDSSDGTIYNHTDGNKYIYIKTTYDGSTTRWVWVSNGTNIYVDYFDSRTGGGSRGPNFNDNDQRNYSGNSNDDTADQLPCPIGFTKIGYDCVKIIEEEDGPSCKSFNYVNITPTWQEAAVINIKFHVYLFDGNGVKYLYSQLYSQPVLFGGPSDLANGGNVSSGIAAEISAKALNDAIRSTVQEFKSKYVNQTAVDIYFKNKLKEEFDAHYPGGRVQFNSTTNLPPTQYQTYAIFPDDCN